MFSVLSRPNIFDIFFISLSFKAAQRLTGALPSQIAFAKAAQPAYPQAPQFAPDNISFITSILSSFET